ncbi:arginine--tRNA ligase [Cytophagaceae bacterium AH-315-L13]|nr:arginine--tRNA ligase [Cytophagaceae bacterium AH-315-L13]
MNLHETIQEEVLMAIKALYGQDIKKDQILIQDTRKEFTGTHTIVVFPLTKISKTIPEKTGEAIGEDLKENAKIIKDFNVIKGFLNLEIEDTYWCQFLSEASSNDKFGKFETNGKSIMVEYSSPNTNKPLHLGHLRTNFLGYSVAKILEANGYEVIKTNLVNDRGIHISKTMIAWGKWANGATPESTSTKGDHFVGEYYVKFDKEYKKEITGLVAEGKSEEEAVKEAPLMKECQLLLQKWEDNDAETRKQWEKMNSWVYDGFAITYEAIGVSFDRIYYESETYLLGKSIVDEGLANSLFFKKDDGSVWIDLTKDGLDEKLLLRSDGTSVYMTQDIGTAQQRLSEYDCEKIVYVVGNEQDYHFKVLNLIVNKMYPEWKDKVYHLSYGMVDLPSGKMKSREGTVVDADDLIQEMIDTSEQHTKELGKIDDFTNEEAEELYRTIGLGALKYHLLKVDPKKRILFNPEESIDFQGNTGPFIQYTYARIQSVLKKTDNSSSWAADNKIELKTIEIELISQIHKYPQIVSDAGTELSPALIANYIFDLAKLYNKFYAELSILGAEEENTKLFRLSISKLTGRTIKLGMELLGISVPEKM